MEAFFKKYPIEASDITAVKMIGRKLDQAKQCLKEDKKSEDYLNHLATTYSMLEDFFDEKNVNPASLI